MGIYFDLGELCKYGFDSTGKGGASGTHSYPWNKQTLSACKDFGTCDKEHITGKAVIQGVL